METNSIGEYRVDILTAQIVFLVIMTIGVCVWCHSLVRALQLGADEPIEVNPWSNSADEIASGNREVGSMLVRGEPEAVSRAIAKAVLQHGTAFEIIDRTAERVLIRKTPASQADPAGAHFSELGFAITPAGENTVEIVYALELGKRRKLLRRVALGIIIGIGLPVLLGLGLFIWLKVIPNPQPGMRWMVFQTIHICHVLWPPFLLIHQHKAIRNHSRAFVTNLLMSVTLADGVESVNAGRGEIQAVGK